MSYIIQWTLLLATFKNIWHIIMYLNVWKTWQVHRFLKTNHSMLQYIYHSLSFIKPDIVNSSNNWDSIAMISSYSSELQHTPYFTKLLYTWLKYLSHTSYIAIYRNPNTDIFSTVHCLKLNHMKVSFEQH